MADAVDWLVDHTWADANRVGMTGYSFGGFMTASSMIFTDKYRLGIAGGGVYDWRMYDSIYTERYMGTPQDNAEGYRTGSVFQRVATLKEKKLLLAHGTGDDNVHFQNSVELINAMIADGNQDFDVAIYPNRQHSISENGARPHLYRHINRFLKEHLPSGAPAPPRSAANATRAQKRS